MTPGPFDVDSDLNRWAPENLRSELERALHRAQHLLIVGRLGSGRTRAARLACQLLANAGETATIVHLGDGVAQTQGRTIFVAGPGVRVSDLPDKARTLLVTVHPWERDELRSTLARVGVDRGVADRLYAHTGGHLMFLRAWDAAGRPEDLTAPEIWQSPVDRALDALTPEARGLAEELSCGYGVLTEPAAPTLAGATGDPSALLAELDEAALLGVGGELLPVAGGALGRRLPPYRRQWLRRRFLADLTDPVGHRDLLITWARSGQSDPHLSRHLTTCADCVRFSDPTLAVELYEAASAHAADDPGTQARVAEAALLLGDHAGALRAAEPALACGSGATRFRGLRVIQQVWSDKGLPLRAATLNSRYADNASLLQAASSFLAHVRVGDLPAAEQAWKGRPDGVATTIDEIAVVALVDTMRTSATTGEADHTELDRLAELGRDISVECRNLTGWVSVTAALAVAAGHAEAARSLLRHLSEQADFTGEHHLLLAWTELQAGHLTEAVERLALARTLPLTPRDELLGCGLDLALAQRRHDGATLASAWPVALAAASRCEPDLFGLTVYPDLIVAAARLREGPSLEQVWNGAQSLLARLGRPPVWSNLLDWARIQSAILISDKDQLREPAQRLARAANRSPQAAVLASAGRVWIDVLAKSFDPVQAIAAARSLATVGLPGDGARLSSHAAARCDDPALRRDLLDTARLLNPGLTSGNASASTPPTSLRLSDREIQVAALVVRHRSYREIGEALFLSPRTVENHIARIRRRSGAGSRRELIDQLRQTLRDMGQLG